MLMDERLLKRLLCAVRDGDLSIGEAIERVRGMVSTDMGFARLDLARGVRCGLPEAIFCQGKTVEQVQAIARRMLRQGLDVLATRATDEMHRAVCAVAKDAKWFPEARAIVVKRTSRPAPPGEILVVCAGTADVPVAEEARVTAEFLDNKVRAIFDVGVAGLHRLLRHHRDLRRANVLIVVAGMEGALASVVSGLVSRPVIAVPTSIGYGASFGGVAPLLAMLNSCASGVAVVNIDNGYGAACVASLINRTGLKDGKG